MEIKSYTGKNRKNELERERQDESKERGPGSQPGTELREPYPDTLRQECERLLPTPYPKASECP